MKEIKLILEDFDIMYDDNTDVIPLDFYQALVQKGIFKDKIGWALYKDKDIIIVGSNTTVFSKDNKVYIAHESSNSDDIVILKPEETIDCPYKLVGVALAKKTMTEILKGEITC